MGKNNHRTRAQARRARRALVLCRRARYDRMRGAADNWRRERALLENVNSTPGRDWQPRDAEPDLESEEREPRMRGCRQERDRLLDIARSEEASRRTRERDAVEWGERFGPAARDAGRARANPVSGMVGRL